MLLSLLCTFHDFPFCHIFPLFDFFFLSFLCVYIVPVEKSLRNFKAKKLREGIDKQYLGKLKNR